MLPSLAGLYAMTGRYELAFDLIAQTDVILAELGLTMRSSAPDREAYVAILAGEPAQAEERLRAGYERLAEMGEKALLASTAALLAHAVYAQGRYEEAYSLTEVCEEAAAPEDVSAQIGWRAVRGKILAKRGSSREAEALARQAVALAERTDLLTERADALLGLAGILRGVGRLEEAAAAARRGLELYERKGNLVGAAEARSLLDEYVPA
jgi:ATP/maltotriose-dependent transcriptional regulator MalT